MLEEEKGSELNAPEPAQPAQPVVEEPVVVEAVAPPPPPPKPDIIDIMYGVIAEPNKTFAELAKEPRPRLGVAIYAGVMVVGAFASGTSLKALFGLTGGTIVGFSIAAAAVSFISWAAHLAMTHFTAELLGGRGTAFGLVTVAGVAALPSVLSIPVTILASRSPSAAGASIFTAIGVGIWEVVLSILAIKHNYRLSTGRSIAVYFLPAILAIVAVIVISVIIVLLVGTSLFKGIPRLPSLP